MEKKIIIIGGGISGLATLHFLKKKIQSDPSIQVTLLEKNEYFGGTIRSMRHDDYIFETGPNGFLDVKLGTLEFIKELGLENSLIKANENAKRRFIFSDGRLYEMPTNVKKFLLFPLFSLVDKLRIIFEFFIPKGCDPNENAYDFAKRRLGEKFAKFFIDPLVTGIYGGNAKTISLRLAFPHIFDIEQKYGSLFKGIFQLSKNNKNPKVSPFPKGTLTSFKQGMGEVIEKLSEKYSLSIQKNEGVQDIRKEGNQFCIQTAANKFYADYLFFATPAYATARIIKNLNVPLGNLLAQINYAPIAVVGLVYKRSQFRRQPEGFGYLVPSHENKEVLGVLFESNIFASRTTPDKILLRILLGGAHHPEILKKSKDELTRIAKSKINSIFGLNGDAEHGLITFWEKAIPQYDAQYAKVIPVIKDEMLNLPNVFLSSNYLEGVSFNDCIHQAKVLVDNFAVNKKLLDYFN